MTGDGSRAPGGHPSPAGSADAPEVAVLRRTPAGWSVGEEDAGDLTCAMVLADLIAAELPDPTAEASDYVGTTGDAAASGGPAGAAAGTDAAGRPAAADPAAPSDQAGDEGSPDEARRLRATVRQLERALAVRIRVEQAIGILAERHRVRPRQAFEQLRAAARGRGQRVIDIAGDVVASATNPLLPLPEELSRPAMAPRPRSRSQRRSRGDQ
jgi:ANTAR domain